MKKLIWLLCTFLLVSCEENELDNSSSSSSEDIEVYYVEDFNEWSEGVLSTDGTTFLLKNNESTGQTEQVFMFLPDGESGIIAGYIELDENSVPTFIAFDDTRVYIQEYTDETISFTMVQADTLMYMVKDYEHHLDLTNVDIADTRAWADNNWVRNTVAIGQLVVGAVEIGSGVVITIGSATAIGVTAGTSLVGVANGAYTIMGGINTFMSGLTKLVGTPDSYINIDTTLDALLDNEGANGALTNLLKNGVGKVTITSWADLSLSMIDYLFGETKSGEVSLIDFYWNCQVITGRYENVRYSSATLYGYVSPVTDIPDIVDVEYGIVVYETEDKNNRQYKSSSSQAGGLFNFLFVDLREDTEYSYFTYFYDKTNVIGMYGEIQTFRTDKNREREVLCALYESTNGDGWNDNTNWCTDAPLDEWYGVTLNEEGYVESIDLYDNNLRGGVSIYWLYYLKNLNLSSNYLTGLQINGDAQIDNITLDNCIVEYGRVELECIDNVLISNNEAIGGVSCGKTQELEISNCDFGDNSVLSGETITSLWISDCSMYSVDGTAQEATILNCEMHHCGITSEILNFNYSSTYNTWYANTSKQLNIIGSYCSTICGGDFNDNTVIRLQNATLWRSNWDENSLVTLSCTITGAQWNSLFESE